MNDETENQIDVTQLSSGKVEKIIPALIKAQSEMASPTLDKVNGHLKNRYSSVGEILRVVKPALNSYGLLLTMPTVRASGHDERVVVRVWHSGGQWLQSSAPILMTREGSQAYGSGLTYALRQALCALFGIVGEEDDDGDSSTPRGPARSVKKSTPRNTKKSDAHARALSDALKAFALAETAAQLKEAQATGRLVHKASTTEERVQITRANDEAVSRVEERIAIQGEPDALQVAIDSATESQRKAKRGDK